MSSLFTLLDLFLLTSLLYYLVLEVLTLLFIVDTSFGKSIGKKIASPVAVIGYKRVLVYLVEKVFMN